MDLISIIVPVYNVEKYLLPCVDSILRQTYENLQILLVDDGSTDGSSRICDEYAQKDLRIEVIHKVNGGLSDARNVGIERAKGKYLSLVDSDDVIALDMIQLLYEDIALEGADISSCQYVKTDESGVLVEKDNEPAFARYVLTGNEACMHDYINSVQGINTVAWAKLYSTALFDGIRYPKGKYHEDVFTTYRLVAKANKIVVRGERKYLYRMRNASITNSSFSPKHLDAVEAKIEMANYMKIHYPKELAVARSGIVYAINICALKMGMSQCVDKNYIDYLQSKCRTYEMSYLRYSKGRFVSKIFSLFAYVNLDVLVRFLSIVYKVRKYLHNALGKKNCQ